MSISFLCRGLYRLLFILLGLAFIINNPCLAWEGYDEEDAVLVEIKPGNLVREGNIIELYDWLDNDYHPVEVKFMEGDFNGTRLEVYDLTSKKSRILQMNNR